MREFHMVGYEIAILIALFFRPAVIYGEILIAGIKKPCINHGICHLNYHFFIDIFCEGVP